MKEHNSIPLASYREYSPDEMLMRSRAFYNDMQRRRSVRQFSHREVPPEIIENCIAAAGTSPSGANMQPWHFVAVSDHSTKEKIRVEAEKVEKAFYTERASQDWLEALVPLGTDEDKSFLEDVPWLIAIFASRYTVEADGKIRKHYYVTQSVGIATGILITAIHHAGLVCLTHTPHPMKFLRKVLNRPKIDEPFLLLAVGYPHEKAQVPDIQRKKLDEIATFI